VTGATGPPSIADELLACVRLSQSSRVIGGNARQVLSSKRQCRAAAVARAMGQIRTLALQKIIRVTCVTALWVLPDGRVGDLCKELGVTPQTLYRFVGPKGQLRADGGPHVHITSKMSCFCVPIMH
jgi:hypothetical protein